MSIFGVFVEYRRILVSTLVRCVRSIPSTSVKACCAIPDKNKTLQGLLDFMLALIKDHHDREGEQG